jgi:signal transduction histidine kinase/ActR/RegA family two-component response regulator
MSELAKLQNRLSNAYHPASASGEAASADALAAPAVEIDALTSSSRTAQAFSRLFAFSSFRLFSLGLLAIASALVLGYATGLYALFGVIAVTFAALSLALLPLPSAARMIAPSPAERLSLPTTNEQQEDREWQQDENVTLLFTIHDALGDLAVTRDMDRRIVQANATFREMTGYRSPEGRTCEEIGLAFRPGAQQHRYDVEICTPYGQRVYVWHDVMARDPVSGRLILQSIGRDVTDERVTARNREEARLKAESTSAAKSRLLATVSHEIRTPLSGILGMSHLLWQTRLTSEQENYLAGIRQSGNALVQLVEDLLDFSIIEAGRFRLNPRSESLRTLVESVVEMLAYRAHEKGIEIGSTVTSEVPVMMDFDPARLRQVLFNVIGNAVKFTEKGGVLIRASMDVADLVIEVTDTGPGMTADEQARVFAEFEQAGSARERSGGSGLGLAISARIMREFGGSLSVSSRQGKGSVFCIRFPAQLSAFASGPTGRNQILQDSHVLLLAPEGPASAAIAGIIATLGGVCHLATGLDDADLVLDSAIAAGTPCTDIIVDHRMAAEFSGDLSNRPDIAAAGMRKIFLVNPEERNSRQQGLFDAWLIRPLREQSLIDVLNGRMRGVEKRDALNDNQPGFGFSLPEAAPATGLSVLLAEDDPVNAMLVRAMLEKAGHSVRTVSDFTALLAAILGEDAERPDLVLCDLNMPGGNGIAVMGRIRAGERRLDRRPVPVVVLTADQRDATKREALLNGANRVLQKPVDPQQLLDEVRALVPAPADLPRMH